MGIIAETEFFEGFKEIAEERIRTTDYFRIEPWLKFERNLSSRFQSHRFDACSDFVVISRMAVIIISAIASGLWSLLDLGGLQ